MTILKSPFDDKENKAAECFQGAYGLSDDNCAVCGETNPSSCYSVKIVNY